MIDAHVHFWNYDEVRDSWIDDSMSVIRRNFLPADIDKLLIKNSVDGIVAVQADQSLEETRFLVELAEQDSRILGVVGWINCLGENFEEELQEFKKYPKIKGWRHIVQSEPEGFLSHPEFISKIKRMGDCDYTYDILIYHNQMEEAIRFVRKLENQKLVLDHMGKPDIKNGEFESWKKNIVALAASENVYCKLSGLVTEAERGHWTKEMLTPYLDIVFQNFGTSRVMFGSDWPVMLLNANYGEWLQLVKEYIEQLSKEEQKQVLEKNAIHFYNL